VRLAFATMQSYSLKLVLVGDSRVGKSQLSRAFMDKEFKVSTLSLLSLSQPWTGSECIIAHLENHMSNNRPLCRRRRRR
jgi:hypothetical protein